MPKEELTEYKGCIICSTQIHMVGIQFFSSKEDAKHHIDKMLKRKEDAQED